MTAYAGETDRERCLAAGMDDYVAKPIRKTLLAEALGRQVGGLVPLIEKSPKADAEHDFTLDGLLRSIDGNEALLARLIVLFREHTPLLVATIDRSLAESDLAAAERTAHQLAGSFGNFAAARAARIARELETAARQRDLSRASELSKLDSIYARLGDAETADSTILTGAR